MWIAVLMVANLVTGVDGRRHTHRSATSPWISQPSRLGTMAGSAPTNGGSVDPVHTAADVRRSRGVRRTCPHFGRFATAALLCLFDQAYAATVGVDELRTSTTSSRDAGSESTYLSGAADGSGLLPGSEEPTTPPPGSCGMRCWSALTLP